jgi:energy-coupling factor transport system substrate-specific component
MKRIAAPIHFRWKSATMLFAVSLFGLGAFLWPLTTNATGDENLAHSTDAPWLFVIILPLLLGVLLAELSEGGLDAKAIAILGVLVACGAVLRAPVTGVTGFTGVVFLIVLGGRVFGRGFGFVKGAMTLFAWALLTGGVGPWLPFQMLGAAWVGLLAGCLPPTRGRREVVMVAAYGALAGLIYGLVMDMWFWPFTTSGENELHFVPGASVVENLQRFWAFHLTPALGFDVARAAGNAALILVVGTPVLAALRRASRRAAFEAPVIFLDDQPTPEFEPASALPTP